jgi:RNA polymerase sigma factor (sigma-70 family)
VSELVPDLERLRAFDDAEGLRVESEYCGRLFAYVARRVPDVQAREDIVQETFLGAVRGIPAYDPVFTFEQYLFGICRNRTIDYLRRRKAVGTGEPADSSESLPGMDELATSTETPSQLVHVTDVSDQGRQLLVDVLRDWVQETWQQGEFVRLMVVEALLSGRWRNRDTWRRFRLRDETAVAGIKFRALKRLRELALRRDPRGELVPALGEVAKEGTSHLDFDVSAIWRRGHASCPARYWLARYSAGTLAGGPADFVRFHLEEMGCEWCQANLDDVAQADQGDLAPLIERMHASTVQYLRSRSLPDADPAR